MGNPTFRAHSALTLTLMANTRITNAVIVTSNTDPKPSGVVSNPANGSDGTFTWGCVGQKNTGSTSIITFSVLGTASNPSINNASTNKVSATCNVKPATTNYVQITASFTSPSNSSNWTVYIGATGGGTVRFTRGNGGGRTVVKTAVKAAARTVARKPALKSKAKAKAKAGRKAAVKPVAKVASKAGGKVAGKSARKARGK